MRIWGHRMNTKYVQSIFSKSAGLVKTDDVDLSADIDPLRTDAEDITLLQAGESKVGADRQGRRQSRRDNDGD